MRIDRLFYVFFLSIAFLGAPVVEAQTLIGVSGDGSTTPETLFQINQTTASETFVMSLGNGNDGEAIAFNPVDSLMYHSSGISDGDRFWESVNLGATTIIFSGQFTGGPEVDDETLAMAYNPATGRFLVSDRNENFYDTTLGGVATTLGLNTTPDTLKGIVFVGGTLYGVQRGTDDLHTINPANGSSTGTTTVTLAGFTVDGFTGLTAHPTTNVLYAVMKTPGARQLVTINPTTGVATLIGTLNERFSGIAFANFSLAPPAGPVDVPTLSEWGIIIGVFLMGGVLLLYRREQPALL